MRSSEIIAIIFSLLTDRERAKLFSRLNHHYNQLANEILCSLVLQNDDDNDESVGWKMKMVSAAIDMDEQVGSQAIDRYAADLTTPLLLRHPRTAVKIMRLRVNYLCQLTLVLFGAALVTSCAVWKLFDDPNPIQQMLFWGIDAILVAVFSVLLCNAEWHVHSGRQ